MCRGLPGRRIRPGVTQLDRSEGSGINLVAKEDLKGRRKPAEQQHGDDAVP